jgi:DHA2 family multidrug resistance protein
MRNIGSSMGISFVTTWVIRRSQFHQTVLSSHVTASNLTSRQALEHLTNLIQQSGVDCVTARQKASALLYRMLQQQASLLSYVDVFHIMGILFLVIIPLIVLMHRPQHQTAAH